jgi:hypothetical protein
MSGEDGEVEKLLKEVHARLSHEMMLPVGFLLKTKLWAALRSAWWATGAGRCHSCRVFKPKIGDRTLIKVTDASPLHPAVFALHRFFYVFGECTASFDAREVLPRDPAVPQSECSISSPKQCVADDFKQRRVPARRKAFRARHVWLLGRLGIDSGLDRPTALSTDKHSESSAPLLPDLENPVPTKSNEA